LSDGEINSDLAAIYVYAVTALFGQLRVLRVLEVNEGEASRPACLSVINDLHIFDWSVFAKDLLQVPFLCVDT